MRSPAYDGAHRRLRVEPLDPPVEEPRRTRPARRALDLGARAANARASAHTYVRVLRRAFRRRPTFLVF